MATMNRNLNLEEVNSDAFMGIPFLNYQSIGQKIVFLSSVVLSVVIMLVGTFYFKWNANMTVFICLIPLLVGVAFGGNYNQDLSLIKYLHLVLFKPSKRYEARPTEDLAFLRTKTAQFIREKEYQKLQDNRISPKEHRRTLFKLMFRIAVVVAIFSMILVLIKTNKTEEIHHTVQHIIPRFMEGWDYE